VEWFKFLDKAKAAMIIELADRKLSPCFPASDINFSNSMENRG